MFYYILPLLFDLAIMAESQCDFVHTSHIACGKSIQYDDDFSIIPLFLCEKNTACHLQRLNCFTQHNVPECMLILFRSGLFDISSSTLNLKICQKHRDALGIYWKRKAYQIGKGQIIANTCMEDPNLSLENVYRVKVILHSVHLWFI